MTGSPIGTVVGDLVTTDPDLGDALTVASIFLFNLLWDTWWPAILVAVGIGIVAGYALGTITRKTQGPGEM